MISKDITGGTDSAEIIIVKNWFAEFRDSEQD